MVEARPAGYPVLTPYLIVRDAAAAIDFYCRVFGAVERLRLPGPGGRVGHAELAFGESLIMLADEAPEHGGVAPRAGERGAISLQMYVDDVDAVVAAALAAGASVVREVATQFYGDRTGSITDPFGHVWHIATHVEDVALEELARRAGGV